jgi:single-stranded-DNA-specific exonuclease
MDQMDIAVDRIQTAIDNDEGILIYGDYDVDGTTSVVLMYDFLQKLTKNISFYLPDRYEEGYGVSVAGVEYAEAHGYTLIICLDCGIRATENIHYAKTKGIDFIVCDHHLPGDQLPEAVAILDPKKPSCSYPYDELSGCGIGFKLVQAMALAKNIPMEQVFAYLDLVSISIGADIVPITGENRILTYFGLRKLNANPRPGVRALMEISGKRKPFSVSDVVFGIAPRINAAGRMKHAREAAQLLLCTSMDETEPGAKSLNQMNNERKTIDSTITTEAISRIEKDPTLMVSSSTVLYEESWHKGIVGIVASRVIERYYRPTIILTASKGKATGSARSIKDFNIHDAIMSCEELLDQFGGHKYAAGLTLPIENVAAFTQRFETVVERTLTEEMRLPKLIIDHALNFDQINLKFQTLIRQMEPHGPGNPAPVFASQKVYCSSARVVGENHLKLTLKQEGYTDTFDGIAFRMSDLLPQVLNNRFNIAFHIELNEFRGIESLQLIIKDIQFPDVA